MAKLVAALDLGSSGEISVWVRVPPSLPILGLIMRELNVLLAQEIYIVKHKVTGKCIFVRAGERYPQKEYALVLNVTANEVYRLILENTT